MWQQLLVGIDGSRDTTRRSARAVTLARALRARLLCCHASAGPDATESTLDALGDLTLLAQSHGVTCATLVHHHPYPWHALLECAVDAKADVLCLAPRRHHPWFGRWWGSTTRRVLARAAGPVLLLRGRQGVALYRRLLVWLDHAPAAGRAAACALALAARTGARVTLLAVSAPLPALNRADVASEAAEAQALSHAQWSDTLAAWRARAAALGVQCSAEIVPGDRPWDVLTSRLQAQDSDLLVLGRPPEPRRDALREFDRLTALRPLEDVDVLVVP